MGGGIRHHPNRIPPLLTLLRGEQSGAWGELEWGQLDASEDITAVKSEEGNNSLEDREE